MPKGMMRWVEVVEGRARRTRCPYCSGHKVRTGVNDLKTLFPELAEEWNYAKNRDLLPEMVSARSKKSVGWKCLKCSYEWSAAISSRVDGVGCRVCKRWGRG